MDELCRRTFLSFYHMFRELTKNQAWMHALDLEQLVAIHGRYLHGNLFKGRKIVLDKGVLDLHPVEIGSLRVDFRQRLKVQSQAVAKGRPRTSCVDYRLMAWMRGGAKFYILSPDESAITRLGTQLEDKVLLMSY